MGRDRPKSRCPETAGGVRRRLGDQITVFVAFLILMQVSTGARTRELIDSAAALIPANTPEYFCVTPGQVLNFISTSTSTGYVVLTEMT
jgi:hypothetical protein